MGRELSLEQWRADAAPFYDVEPAEGPFELTRTAYPLGEMLFVAAGASGQRFVRDERVLARGGSDHLLVQMYTTGVVECSIDGGLHQIETGDISCLDLTRTFNCQATAFAGYSLVVPRRLLFVMSGDTSLHGRILPANSAGACVLGAHFETLAAACPTADPFDQDMFGRLTAALLEAAFVPRAHGLAIPDEIDRSPYAEICRYIEANLTDPTLSVDWLGDRFGTSRATLYRMFDRAGGVASFIRERRLARAHRALSAVQSSRERISALAARLGFRNEDTFARAFKERYGVSPSHYRENVSNFR